MAQLKDTTVDGVLKIQGKDENNKALILPEGSKIYVGDTEFTGGGGGGTSDLTPEDIKGMGFITNDTIAGDSLGLVKNGGNVTINPDGTMDTSINDEELLKTKPGLIEKDENGTVLGEIFNIYEGENKNQVLGIHSKAEGTVTLAGTKAHTITNIYYGVYNDDYNGLYLASVEGLEVGDIVSVHLYGGEISEDYDVDTSTAPDYYKENFGTIIQINSENLLIYLDTPDDVFTSIDGDFGMSDLKYKEENGIKRYWNINKWGYDTDQNALWVIAKPHVGTRNIGYGAHAEGHATQALMKGAHAEGYETIAYGSYSHTEGGGTIAGRGAHAEGRNTKALGFASHSEGADTTAEDRCAHAEGSKTHAIAGNSHAEGCETRTEGYHSHAEGYATVTQGRAAHAEGVSRVPAPDKNFFIDRGDTYNSQSVLEYWRTDDTTFDENKKAKDFSMAWGEGSHVEGGYNLVLGKFAHAEGQKNLATKESSHVEGYETLACNKAVHAEGYQTISGFSYYDAYHGSHAEGHRTVAMSKGSHAEGYGSNQFDYTKWQEWLVNNNYVDDADREPIFDKVGLLDYYIAKNKPYLVSYGEGAHAEGCNTLALGNKSHASGMNTVAYHDYQRVHGKHNQVDNGSSIKYVDIVGWGGSKTALQNIYTLNTDGQGYFAGGTTTTGEDYAEFFEWEDGNPNNEDRVGLLVALDGEHIKPANSGDDILGVISGTVAVLGGNYEWEWNGKYLTDDFGRVQYEEVEEFEDVLNEETGEIEQKSLGFFKHPILNPEYDATKEYVNRADRPEWDTVGMLGKLYVHDDGTCIPNFYATAGFNGVATSSLEKTNMRVLSRVNDNVIRVLLK